MERVMGIGGVFFRARDPDGLARWYEQHLGIDPVPKSEGAKVWEPVGGPTVFAPFKLDTGYFGRESQQFMLNFRVGNLDAMLAQLRAAGIEVPVPDDYPQGRFARVHDPEGNPIELWEPKEE